MAKPKLAANKSNNSTRENRQSKKSIATPAIETIRSIVNILKPYELSQTQRLRTYQCMLLDDAVGNAFAANCILVEKAFANYEITHNQHSSASKEAAEFLRHCYSNMRGQTLRSFARSASEFKRDGLAPFEKTFRKGSGKWQNYWTIDKLLYIHPLSLQQARPFTIINGGRDVSEMRQDLAAFRNSSDILNFEVHTARGYVGIPRNKLALITYSGTDSQPFGVSAFDTCYTAWREKILLQECTLVGVTKDFSGTPILYLPEDLLEKAAADPSSQEGVMVEQLKTNMANMHTGDQNYTILPSDTQAENGSGMRSFELKFMGIDGGGRNFDTVALIEQRKRAIYNAFGAGNLIAGDGAGGSYNMLEGMNNIHSFYIDRDIAVIEEALNTDINPQLFRLNGWDLSPEDMPVVKAGAIEPLSIDEFGKMLQRIAAVSLAPTRDPKFLNEIYSKLGINYRFADNATPESIEHLMSDMTSRSGDGLSSGLGNGVGDSTAKGGDRSTSNKENN
jgi:hypothetical protein